MTFSFKSGYVAFIGEPNVGKSTLLNAILGEEIAIVTPKPQTTRHRIVGILNRPHSQIIFLDTPGFHQSRKPLNQAMLEIVDQVASDADVVCLLVDPGKALADVNRQLFQKIGVDRCVVVINKADTLEEKECEQEAESLHRIWGAKEVVVISALHHVGIGALVETLEARLPEGVALYPTDISTEHSVRLLVSEIIREQLFLQMQQEIPYSTTIIIESFQDATETNPLTKIRAAIIVEKESQKGMVIGAGGKRIKEIGKKSREKIEELVGGKVYLELFVRVEEGWTGDLEKIREFGYLPLGRIRF